ncbi:lysylphosphatidylglycerol synthase transmembrane domain-containing protein [Bacteroides sp. 519]|uniref:lysylphosphatidylglycerol synthase transmembrane domain-containing protein n=1 Tax=Bacteroides sp. 519 TaxID=2302937 RepID=UPI0013D6EB5A|nr:lysylphosphatidylglycerol synthase transmembrane domain-containing protein [Bacteroides sp. 519]NDV60277.1 UPF0104 family protein [Bacteroides sp. 519]
MKNKFRNIFLAFGIVAVIIMMFTFDMDYQELWANIKRAGYYFPLVILLWAFVYMLNALSWYQIIRDGKKTYVPFWNVYKFTITGFALNYVTPVGLMGGEPYRIMELKPYIGVERATSSVILYVMMHIFAHFIFWIVSVFLYITFYKVTMAMGIVLALVIVFCSFFVTLFIKGYRNGMAVAFMRVVGKIPFLKKYAISFAEKHSDKLHEIDNQIALLHQKRKRTFYAALAIEFIARVLSCLELWLILNILTSNVSFIDCILIAAFSSLFANLLFFLPMQLGGREGGFAIAVGGLSMSGAYGVYTALITRLREMVWIVIGLLLMKIGNKK